MMKILYRILISITALALLTLTSCLDDEGLGVEVIRFDEVPAVVDFNEAPNSGGYIVRSFEGTTDPTYQQETTFTVNLSSPYKMDKDLTLTIQFDQAAIDAFLLDNPGWTALPEAKQDFSSESVVIEADTREATFTVNFLTEGLSADDLIISAYTITAVDDPDVLISGNFGTQFVKVGVANVFEGAYAVSNNYWVNPSRTTDYTSLMSGEIFLQTSSSTESITEYFYPPWGHLIVDVDLSSSSTIEGHANAYNVSVIADDWPLGDQAQDDTYDGEVWNYCYQNGDGKWVFKICHDADGWFGHATWTQL